MSRAPATRLLRAALASMIALAPALVLAACTADNSDYGDTVPVDGGVAVRPRDLGGPDCGSGGACKANERGCSSPCAGGGVDSLLCGDKNLFATDRDCPAGATCAKGYCVAPRLQPGGTIGAPCASESQCFVSQQTADISCEPFVVGKSVEWRCGQRVGDGASGNACAKNSECRSGFCIRERKTCFRACAGADNDCPVRNRVQLLCRPVRITVEGVDVMSTSCVSP